MKIRPAKKDDFTGIVTICVASMKATYGSFFTEDQMRPWIEGGETENYVRDMLDSMLVVEKEGDVAAVAALRDDMIDLVWVAQEHRGRGVGTAIMAESERVLHEKGHATGRVEVFEPNGRAISFYERLGWTRKDVYPDESAGINKVLLTKPLS